MRACSVAGFIRGGLPSSLPRSELACPGRADIVTAGSKAEAKVAVTVGAEGPSIPFLGAEGSTTGRGGRPGGPVGPVDAGGNVGVGVGVGVGVVIGGGFDDDERDDDDDDDDGDDDDGDDE
ncbi:hypothetical protein CTA1_11890 [Colletotrichum tanaceti]|uniref:Uncharacterized protein n=1 Tax=Colletotrichum tanaceti TaxID=1306861 RepID=A0A4U6XB07_9PEZI|nr:hypothetical protein CTA1_11890 [Colletotrichum tanaceti]